MNLIEINGDYINLDLVIAIEETNENGFSIKYAGHNYILTYEHEKLKKALFKWLSSKSIAIFDI